MYYASKSSIRLPDLWEIYYKDRSKGAAVSQKSIQDIL